MKKQAHTAFYVETLLLVGALVLAAVVLVRCFFAAEQTRVRARELTEAVHLARNAAEAAAGAQDADDLSRLLAEDGVSPVDAGLRVSYQEDLTPDPAGPLLLEITWDRTPAPGAGLVTYTITVENAERDDELYRLETAVYLGEGTP